MIAEAKGFLYSCVLGSACALSIGALDGAPTGGGQPSDCVA
jgi:hypothetical protein